MRWGLTLVILALETGLGWGQELNVTLTDINGQRVRIADYLKTGPLVISFWATWCGPCKKELPKMEELYQRYKNQPVTVITVNQDNQRSLSKVKSFVKSHRYEMPVLLDPDQNFFRRFNSSGIPLVVVFGADGQQVYNHLGYMPGDEKQLETVILKLLSQKE